MAQLTTFVFTDLVGSVALKGRMPGVDAVSRDAAYIQRVLQPHRERIEAGLAEADGRVVSTAGDGHFLVFPDSARATLWAIGVIRSHHDSPIGGGDDGSPSVEVRIGMHAGAPQPDPTDPDNFVGRAVDYAARLADQAQGSQILVSRTTASLIEDGLLEGVRLHSHGALELRGIGSAELFEVLYPGRSPAPPRQVDPAPAKREWSVLPRTMGLTEYVAQSGQDTQKRASGGALTKRPPRKVGNYQLDELLGTGGMGNVYKGRHAQFDRPRAIKIIRPDLVESGGDSVVRRFYQEVRATGALEHPNLVVAIDSSSPDDEEHFLVMEYIDGVSVDRLIEIEGPLPVADACEIARQAALGLSHLYEQGLVHRDVKPSNMMVTLTDSPHLPPGLSARSGSGGSSTLLPIVKLMDLGLALLVRGDQDRVTQFDRGGMGTGYYMPPEQWRTTSVDIRADVYSLGCTLYHLLMGEPPYAASDLKPERAHSTSPIPPLRPACGAPRELAELVSRMLAKRPEDRPQTPAEVARELEPFAAGSRLGERIERLRREGLTNQSLDRQETVVVPAEAASFDTRRPAPALLKASSSIVGGRRFPWLLTAVTTVVACVAVLSLGAMRAAMLERHRASLVRTAGFAADKMSDAIDARVDILEKAAEDDRVAGWLLAIEQVDESQEPGADDAKSELQRWLVNRRDRAGENYPSSSWFVTDARGVQLARSPPSATIGRRFDSRDYFHGKGPDYTADPEAPTPIDEPHQSAVYRSKSRPEDLKVAFSVPIWSGRRVAGVLAMSVVLGDFRELDKTDSIADDVEILLADIGGDNIEEDTRHGLVLHHRKLRAGERLAEPLLNEVRPLARGDRATMLSPYADILGRNSDTYWGAIAAVVPERLPREADGGWVVIAQEPKP